ncbi:MAG TPA: MmcQ/YjbR family DNA-binding protein [Bacteroidia bacterium]|jgi:predicted DNA-binding protein (MmcQ/YjbR family)|nr:MmcQ/YjbR family DNA-binding protein [Bacteroidia bacterium]
MYIEDIRAFCKKLPQVTEDVKWGNDLCFCIGGKMFCVAPLKGELTLSFKVQDEEFDELSTRPGFVPALYVARYKWVLLQDVSVLKRKELEGYIKQSYELIRSRLPKKALK